MGSFQLRFLITATFIAHACSEPIVDLRHDLRESAHNERRFTASFYVNSRNGLVLREKPSAKSRKIALLSFRKLLSGAGKTENCESIDGKQDCWYKIAEGTQIGYVFGAYLVNARPKFFDDFKHDVLNAPPKTIPDIKVASDWKTVREIPGIEFQVPGRLEYKLNKRKIDRKLYWAGDQVINWESYIYFDIAPGKYCETHLDKCATEGGPLRLEFEKHTKLPIENYLRLRIQNDILMENAQDFARISNPWKGYYLHWNDMFFDIYDFIIDQGESTLVYRVRPPAVAGPASSRLTEAEIKTILYSLKILP